LKICYLFNTNRMHCKIVRRRSKTTHQQRVGRSEPSGYQTSCWRVASASTRLRLR